MTTSTQNVKLPFVITIDKTDKAAMYGAYAKGQIKHEHGEIWSFTAKILESATTAGINGAAVPILSISDQPKWKGGIHEIFNYHGRIDTVSRRVTPLLIESLISALAKRFDLPFADPEEVENDGIITEASGFPRGVTFDD